MKSLTKNNIEDYLGKKVTDHLTVIGLDPDYIGRTYNANHWIFQCDCGNKFSDMPSRVLSGHRKSCGCQRYKGCITHGCNRNEFYPTWWSMIQRCYNPKIDFNGETHNMSEWARVLGIKKSTLTQRLLYYGWSVEEAFTTPPNGKRKHKQSSTQG